MSHHESRFLIALNCNNNLMEYDKHIRHWYSHINASWYRNYVSCVFVRKKERERENSKSVIICKLFNGTIEELCKSNGKTTYFCSISILQLTRLLSLMCVFCSMVFLILNGNELKDEFNHINEIIFVSIRSSFFMCIHFVAEFVRQCSSHW